MLHEPCPPAVSPARDSGVTSAALQSHHGTQCGPAVTLNPSLGTSQSPAALSHRSQQEGIGAEPSWSPLGHGDKLLGKPWGCTPAVPARTDGVENQAPSTCSSCVLPLHLLQPNPRATATAGGLRVPGQPQNMSQPRVPAHLNTCPGANTRVPHGDWLNPDLGCPDKVRCVCFRAAACGTGTWGRGDMGIWGHGDVGWSRSVTKRPRIPAALSRFSKRAAPDPDELGHHKGLCIPGSLLEI